jgi:hypothetical protein
VCRASGSAIARSHYTALNGASAVHLLSHALLSARAQLCLVYCMLTVLFSATVLPAILLLLYNRQQHQHGFSSAQGIELSPVFLRTPPELHVAHHDISRDNYSNISNANDSATAAAAVDDDEPSPKDLEPLVSVHRNRSDPPAFIGPAVTYVVKPTAAGETAAGVTADRRAAHGAYQLLIHV